GVARAPLDAGARVVEAEPRALEEQVAVGVVLDRVLGIDARVAQRGLLQDRDGALDALARDALAPPHRLVARIAALRPGRDLDDVVAEQRDALGMQLAVAGLPVHQLGAQRQALRPEHGGVLLQEAARDADVLGRRLAHRAAQLVDGLVRGRRALVLAPDAA